jgi:hypothetical protein
MEGGSFAGGAVGYERKALGIGISMGSQLGNLEWANLTRTLRYG